MSKLSQYISAEQFKMIYEKFIEQADKNYISGKSGGTRAPYGFDKPLECDGAHLLQHFGQGRASETPYINWWVVSIYYIPSSKHIIMGIEENRYNHISSMQPLRYDQIGRKKQRIAVFYSTDCARCNYYELYREFIKICSEVLQLGLE